MERGAEVKRGRKVAGSIEESGRNRGVGCGVFIIVDRAKIGLIDSCTVRANFGMRDFSNKKKVGGALKIETKGLKS